MVDFEKLKMMYKFGKGLSLSDAQVLFKSAKSKKFEPNDYLLKEGSVKKEIYFIKKGLIRIFSINDKGEEITVGLFWENQPYASIDIIMMNQPSRHYAQALESTEILYIDYDLLENIVSKNPKLSHNRKFIWQKILKRAQDKIESFILYSPEERYTRFVEANPDIINRVPNKYIANVLGITPVSLSRIRSRIAQKKN
ncbi:MAG: Crp/Fnr family transcriptional regulator [Saprospiraceae bacterium]